MWLQKEFYLDERTRGFHPVTDEVLGKLPPLPRTGLLHLFIKHTSAALALNEDADPDVCRYGAYFRHTCQRARTILYAYP